MSWTEIHRLVAARREAVQLSIEQIPLPLRDGAVSQATDHGILTGARVQHWPCLGALAIAAARQRIPLAVADHGLADWQQAELERCGVRWVRHDAPSLVGVRRALRIPSDLKAWWKPWVCRATPFDVTLWIDSDAVLVGNAADVFDLAAAGPCVSTQMAWQPNGGPLYAALLRTLFGEVGPELLARVASINSGVVAWRTGSQLIPAWREWCTRLMNDPALCRLCKVRDQAGLVATLTEWGLRDDHVTLLDGRWNTPADYMPSSRSAERKSIPLRPELLLAEAAARHPGAIIVHWLGGRKPWRIG